MLGGEFAFLGALRSSTRKVSSNTGDFEVFNRVYVMNLGALAREG